MMMGRKNAEELLCGDGSSKPVRVRGFENERNRRSCLKGVLGIFLIAAVSCMSTACSKPDSGTQETRKLIMGTFTEDSVTDRAGKAVAATISNTVPGVYVETWPSKGAYVSMEHLFDGTYDLVIVPAGAAYEAYTGIGACEGEKKEKLRAVAACYPIVSTWASPKELGLSKVQELKGHSLAVGNEGSETAKVSGEVFDVLGIDKENTEIWYYGIKGGADGIRDQWADGIHAFAESPVPAYQELASEDAIRFLSYTDEELDEILDGHPEYSEIAIPAGTYENQDEEIATFCEKVLVCVSADMDEELVHEIAWALEVNGPVYTAGQEFMRAMDDKKFRASGIPIPLHDGAKRYYEEQGYFGE